MSNLMMSHEFVWLQEAAESGASDFHCFLCLALTKCNTQVDLLDFPAGGGIQDEVSE